jgi:hypothetical protein
MYKFKIHQDRFNQITQRGVDKNAKLSPSGKEAALEAMAALGAYHKTATVATMLGRTELTEHIESQMNKILDNYDASCILDCCA